ncbi:hypothetical protein N3K66_004745 [Trichothecium roseum]|uniref:Uncharacterized protein n=1 Tax=Trichothecium roseum TaxID=47278 RepID=A0ACC0V453_9HYPO|nr:hypothetical protein N3K66_004745 [Trichothecium roseum]
MAITTAISDLFNSLYELLSSVLGTAYAIVHSIFTAAFNFVNGILSLAGDIIGGFINVTEGVAKFIAGNIILLAIGALGAFAYVRFTASGQRLASAKKTN